MSESIDEVGLYQIYCVTESAMIEGLSFTSSPPTVCYNNNAHQVNLSSVSLLGVASDKVVTIKEDKVAIARNVKIEAINFVNVESNSSQTVDYKFNIITSMYSFKFMTDDTNKGDFITIVSNPNTPLGLITQNVAGGATTFYAPPALLLYGQQGFNVVLSDGTNTDDIGYIKTINKTTGAVTFSTPTTLSVLASNGLGYMIYYIMQNVPIGTPATYAFGEDVVGGSAVPVGTIVRFIYQNNSQPGDLTDEPKSMTVYMTILF